MKTRMTLLVVVAALVSGGCKMKEFASTPLYSGDEVEFTGAVEDRVNLWPLAYWREPVGSIVWPVVSWGDDHFAFRPVWSQYKRHGYGEYDEFNLFWPICQFDTGDNDYRVFPFFWGNDRDGEIRIFASSPRSGGETTPWSFCRSGGWTTLTPSAYSRSTGT